MARPKFRLTPERNWMNDPNGLVYYRGEYHAFYQLSPDDLRGGPKHWGHAVSRDGLTWRYLPVALYPCGLGQVFSGSAVVDEGATAGFGAGALVAIFTLHGDAERQAIAYSTDGVTFTMYPGNPVIDNPGLRDFRDPKVFRYGEEWRMAVAAGLEVWFFRSADLIHWEKTGTLPADENPVPGIWECPDLFPVTDEEGAEHWALIGSMIPAERREGASMQALIGRYDGTAFRPYEVPKKPVWLDDGADFYAAVTYYGVPDRRRILLAWMADWHYAADTPTEGYRGQMTLPRELSAAKVGEEYRLKQAFAREVFEKFGDERAVEGEATITSPSLIRLSADGPAKATLQNCTGEWLSFGVDEENHVYVDRTHSGGGDIGHGFHCVRSATRLMKGRAEMVVALDENGVELLADGGLTALTMLAFPSEGWSTLKVEGGEGFIRDLLA